MKARAIQRDIHLSPRKAKLVCDLIRGKKVNDALTVLEYTNKKAAPIIRKLLQSAIANATNNHAMDGMKLYVYHIVANKGRTLKRTNPRAKGSADLIRKRHTHIEIIVSDDLNERQNDLNKIKELKSKRAQNNKGYSAKQRSGKIEVVKKVKTEKKTSVSNDTKKTNVKNETPKSVNPETLKREQQALKAVEIKKSQDGKPMGSVEATSIIMISTTPEHANILFDDNSKKTFFYKVTPINKISRVLIYATAPINSVVGEFDLVEIKIQALSTAWKNYGSNSVLTKKEFDKYYEGKKEAHVIVVGSRYRYSKPKNLSEYNMQTGPKGFQYLK